MAGGRNNQHSPEERELALGVTAAFNGNTRRASKELAKQGVKIPHSTLHGWAAKSHVSDYLRIRDEKLPELKARMAEKLEEVVQRGAELQVLLLDDLHREYKGLKPGEKARVLKDTGITAGIASQRSAELRGEATVVVERRGFQDIERGLRRLGLVIDSTAVEVTDDVRRGSEESARTQPNQQKALPSKA